MPSPRPSPLGRADIRACTLARRRSPSLGPTTRSEEKMRSVLYFAYGSNLDDDQMRTRCPSAVMVGRAVLAHHALAFGGFSHHWSGPVASVVRARGAHVAGILYAISAPDLHALDCFEGHPFAYERVVKMVVDGRGQRRRATLYLQPEEGFETWAPSIRYFGVLWRAYTRLGFDRTPLAVALRGAR